MPRVLADLNMSFFNISENGTLSSTFLLEPVSTIHFNFSANSGLASKCDASSSSPAL
jgi:hypothetical protein